jgi:hypothetical protein
MRLQRQLVVGALIAEGRAEGLQQRTACNQSIPEVMPDFVAEMPQKSAIRFLLQGPLLLTVHVVGLRDVERY